MGDVGGETDMAAADEDGGDHRHVRRVGRAALVGVVDQEGVARGEVIAVTTQHRRRAVGKGADMQGQHHVLGHHVAGGVQQRAAGILGFPDDGRKAGAEEAVLHLPDDADQGRLDDLEGDGIDLGRPTFPPP